MSRTPLLRSLCFTLSVRLVATSCISLRAVEKYCKRRTASALENQHDYLVYETQSGAEGPTFIPVDALMHNPGLYQRHDQQTACLWSFACDRA